MLKVLLFPDHCHQVVKDLLGHPGHCHQFLVLLGLHQCQVLLWMVHQGHHLHLVQKGLLYHHQCHQDLLCHLGQSVLMVQKGQLVLPQFLHSPVSS